MKNDLTTRAWQHNIGCPISVTLLSTSDVVKCWPPSQTLWGSGGETKATKKNGTKKPWRWDAIHQQAFDNVKSTIAIYVVLAYLDFTKSFEIYTDASILQLGAVITQENRPLAIFSRKLTKTQSKCVLPKLKS
jgi:hypothetical protein